MIFLQDVESYSGFLTVDKPNNGNMFFWFFPAGCHLFWDKIAFSSSSYSSSKQRRILRQPLW